MVYIMYMPLNCQITVALLKANGCRVIGIAGGPALAGRLYDLYGNYLLALWILGSLFVAGALAALSLPRFEAVRARSPGA